VPIYALIMEHRRREVLPAGYAAAVGAVLACGAALAVSQEELDRLRQACELEPVELPPPGLMQDLLHDIE
jgi:hypothetical protein